MYEKVGATEPPPSAPARPAGMKRVVIGCLVGTALETYDLYLYGTAAALVFGPLFFPAGDATVATLLALATFAVSFVARPVGALVFGHFGDRIGRKTLLYLTLLMMGLSTFLIGLLPTYSSIGILAPTLLIVLRVIQGFGFAGEYSGAVLMLAEHAPPGRRGFYAGLNSIGPVFGFVASSGFVLLMSTVLSREDFLSWGWRIPFLASIVLVAIGLYVRNSVPESPVFARAARDAAGVGASRLPVVLLFRHYWKELLLGSGANITHFATFYLLTVFSLSYGTSMVGVSSGTVLSIVIIAVTTNAVTIPIASAVADRIGRRRTLATGLILIAVWAVPFWMLFDTGVYALMLIGAVVLMVVFCFVYGPLASFTAEIFGVRVRYTGSAVAYNVGGILGAAFAPIIATLLLQDGRGSLPIALYMIALCALSLTCVLLSRETRDVDLTADRSATR